MAFYDEISGGLITYWKTVSAITTLVGTGNSARIYPQTAKQGVALPYVVFIRVDGRPFIHLGGATGARVTVLHVYCYGATAAAADALAEAVKQNTQTMRGTYSSVVVNRVQVDSIDDGFEFASQGTDQKDFWVRLVIRLVHGETGGV